VTQTKSPPAKPERFNYHQNMLVWKIAAPMDDCLLIRGAPFKAVVAPSSLPTDRALWNQEAPQSRLPSGDFGIAPCPQVWSLKYDPF
jgi:hypothetical protein